YITDLVEHFYKQGQLVLAHQVADYQECLGVNHSEDLSLAHKVLNWRNIQHWMSEGVFFASPETSWVEDRVQLSSDVRIGPGVILQGETRIEEEVILEAYCVIRNSRI